MGDEPKLLTRYLLCRAHAWICALRLDHVVETMRPLPVQAIIGAPPFIQGVAVIRGRPVPVVDVASMLGVQQANPTRFVTVKLGNRRVALLFDSTLGVRDLPAESLTELPPLLHDADTGVVAAIGTLDTALLVVLENARLIPESFWDALPVGEPQP